MNNVRYYRKLRGMTQQELADAAGITRYTISRLENEKNQISTETLIRLSNVLKCSESELLGR